MNFFDAVTLNNLKIFLHLQRIPNKIKILIMSSKSSQKQTNIV